MKNIVKKVTFYYFWKHIASAVKKYWEQTF